MADRHLTSSEQVEAKAGGEIKQLDDAGAGLARIATLSAIDADGDTYEPGAFGEQHAKVLAAHAWQIVPLGKARVFEQGDEALAEFHLNLDSQTAREWHAALKFDMDAERSGGRPLQEWSYGFRVIDSETETRDGDPVRVLKRLEVHEISPVVLGAGIGTATLAVKTGRRRFADQIADAVSLVSDIRDRTKEIAALRAEDDRALSAARRAELRALKDALDGMVAVGAELDALIREGEADPREAGRLLAAFEAKRSRIGTVEGGCCLVDGVRIKGRALSRLLRSAIDDMVTDDRSRSDIVADIASRARLASGTINAIVSGEINCPSRPPIRAFAAVLDGVTQDDIVRAMDEDGCDTDNIPSETR